MVACSFACKVLVVAAALRSAVANCSKGCTIRPQLDLTKCWTPQGSGAVFKDCENPPSNSQIFTPSNLTATGFQNSELIAVGQDWCFSLSPYGPSAGECHEKVEMGWNFDSTDSSQRFWTADPTSCLEIYDDMQKNRAMHPRVCSGADSQRFVVRELDSLSAIIL